MYIVQIINKCKASYRRCMESRGYDMLSDFKDLFSLTVCQSKNKSRSFKQHEEELWETRC